MNVKESENILKKKETTSKFEKLEKKKKENIDTKDLAL